jgi:hypothetical protein
VPTTAAVLAPVSLSRAQRAHDRLDFPERLARNTRISPASPVTIRLFGVPERFAVSLGLATASSRLVIVVGVFFLGQTGFSEWERMRLFFLLVLVFPLFAVFALHPAVFALSSGPSLRF